MIKKIVLVRWKRFFFLEIPVNPQNDQIYDKGKKSDIPDENLLSSTNKISKKAMESAAISWYGLRSGLRKPKKKDKH